MAAKKLNSMNKLSMEAPRPPHPRRPHASSSRPRWRPASVQLVPEARDVRVRDWRRRRRHLFGVFPRERWRIIGMNWEAMNLVEEAMMIFRRWKMMIQKPNPISYLIEFMSPKNSIGGFNRGREGWINGRTNLKRKIKKRRRRRRRRSRLSIGHL